MCLSLPIPEFGFQDIFSLPWQTVGPTLCLTRRISMPHGGCATHCPVMQHLSIRPAAGAGDKSTHQVTVPQDGKAWIDIV